MSSPSVHLYYFPGSFYSQRVAVALSEKKIQHTITEVSLISEDQLTPWFLRLNPKGQIPLLKVGDKLISESETIVDVVDSLDSPESVKLIPHTSTSEGRLVSDWRKKLDDVEVEEITYGVMLDNGKTLGTLTGGIKLIATLVSSREKYNKRINSTIERLEKMKRENPDLSECIDQIIAKQKVRVNGTRYRPEDVKVKLEELDGIMDEAEQQLKKNGPESWLCGPKFSVADIHLSTLLGRLKLLGLVDRYVDPKTRPMLVAFWTRAQQRPSIKDHVIGAIPKCLRIVFRRKLAWFASRAVAAGVIVAAAVIIAKRYNNS